jgi:hypothetical protein
LNGEALTASIATSCAPTGRKLTIETSSSGNVRALEPGASPLLFEPQIDWERFKKPHIIDDF